MAKNRTVLTPQYMHEFTCIGPACEDSCCIGWRVNVDEPTYKKYRKVKHPELKPLMDKQVTRNRSTPSATNYAKIKVQKDSRCPFLAEDMLCNIHRTLGEEYLSLTCATYPRTCNDVNGVLERSATMSCPEAARLALLPEGEMEFDQELEAIDIRKVLSGKVNPSDLKLSLKPERYFWELRIFSIQILQTRDYSLWQRLVILGLFLQKAQELADNKQMDQLEQLIQLYMGILADGSLKDSMGEIPDQVMIQFRVLKELVDKRVTKGVTSKRYLECFGEFLKGLEYVNGATYKAVAQNYKEGYEDYYQPYMKEHEHILENYLVNHVFKNLFPLGKRGLYGEYSMFVIHYAMIKMHLIGMARHHKGLDDDLVIKLIQSFAKTVEHNTAYLHQVYELLQENEFTSMAHMSILVKN